MTEIGGNDQEGKEKLKIKGTDKKCQDTQGNLDQDTEEGKNQMKGRGSSTM